MSWREDASCADYSDPEAFFPEGETEREQLRQTVTARTICAMCTVSHSCFNEAVKTKDFYSVAGGTVPAQRKKGRLKTSPHYETTAEEALFLFEGGLSPEHIARALNVQMSTVERSFTRLGIKTPWVHMGQRVRREKEKLNS